MEGKPADLAMEFVDCLVKGDFDQCCSYFSAKMKQALPARKLEQTWKDLLSQTGPFVKKIDKQEKIIDDYDVIFVTSEFEKEQINIRIVFDENRRVAGLWFEPVP